MVIESLLLDRSDAGQGIANLPFAEAARAAGSQLISACAEFGTSPLPRPATQLAYSRWVAGRGSGLVP
jgi:hypothetical protein